MVYFNRTHLLHGKVVIVMTFLLVSIKIFLFAAFRTVYVGTKITDHIGFWA